MTTKAVWILTTWTLGAGLAHVLPAAGPAFISKARPAGESSSWTEEDYLNAKPMPMPEVAYERLRPAHDGVPRRATGPSQFGDASPPRRGVTPNPRNFLFDPRKLARHAEPEEALDLSPKARGSSALDFTSSRLVPLSADRQAFYTAVGKLFFETPEGSFVCSGAVIAKRLVLTAGHCVHDGMSAGAGGFFDDFVFVPAYRDGNAPFEEWDWEYVVVTSGWVNSDAEFPAQDDFAIIVVGDRGGDSIGEVTGSLGWQTQKLSPNQVTLLGYPQNLDGGQKMHQVNAGQSEETDNDTAIYGSDMRGGASGGPWVQNFGAKSQGQSGGSNTGFNRIVGVTSFSAVSNSPRYNGSSVLNSAFSAIRQDACDQAPGNC